MKRFKKILAAVGIGALAVMAVPTAAQAHAGDMDATAVCNTATGDYDVTYTVNWTRASSGENTLSYRTGEADFSNGWNLGSFDDWSELDFNGGTGSYSFTESIPGDSVNGPWAYAFIEWSDGYGQQKVFDTRAEGLGGDCEANIVEAVPVPAEFTQPICEANEDGPGFTVGNGYVTIPETEGVTYLFNGGDAVSGVEYPLTAGGSNVLTAIAQDGYYIEGDFEQVIEMDSPVCMTPPEPSTPIVPDQPEPVTDSWFVPPVIDCDTGLATDIEVTSTQEYTYDEETNTWVLGEPVFTTEEFARGTTVEECPLPEVVDPPATDTPVIDTPVIDTPDVDTPNPIQRFPSDNAAPTQPVLASTGFGLAVPLLAGLGGLGTGVMLLLRRRK